MSSPPCSQADRAQEILYSRRPPLPPYHPQTETSYSSILPHLETSQPSRDTQLATPDWDRSSYSLLHCYSWTPGVLSGPQSGTIYFRQPFQIVPECSRLFQSLPEHSAWRRDRVLSRWFGDVWETRERSLRVQVQAEEAALNFREECYLCLNFVKFMLMFCFLKHSIKQSYIPFLSVIWKAQLHLKYDLWPSYDK